MNICILTPRFPFPENGGDVLRINHIARYLKSCGHRLVLVSFYEGNNMPVTEALYDKVYAVRRRRRDSVLYAFTHLLCGKPIQCGYYHSPAYRRTLREVVEKEKPDLFVSHLLRMSPYLEELGVESRSVVEMTDALSKTYSMLKDSKGSVLKSFVYSVERSLIARYEKHVIQRFPKVVLVSGQDIDYLKAQMPSAGTQSLRLHTNGVSLPFTARFGFCDNRKICFIGNMRTLQNQDAVLHFVKDIFPLVQKQMPQAQFYIVGAEPPSQIRQLADGKSIFVTGFVEDLVAAVADSCVAVAPVRVAAGIQNKVLVAMGMSVPVVLTSLIAKAIPELRDGENCFIRDDAPAFAQAVVALMQNEALRNTTAHTGRLCVEQNYGWNGRLAGYEII